MDLLIWFVATVTLGIYAAYIIGGTVATRREAMNFDRWYDDVWLEGYNAGAKCRSATTTTRAEGDDRE